MASGDDDTVAETSAPPPKKRSLFTFSTVETTKPADEAVDFFSRAKELRSTMLAQEEERRQKRLLKMERKRSNTRSESKEMSPPQEKRRKVSGQSRNDAGYSSDENNERETSRIRRESSHSPPRHRLSYRGSESRVTQASPKSGRSTNPTRQRTRQPTTAITLSESESDVDAPRMTLPVRKPENQPITLLDSDEEFLSLQKPAKISVEEENVSDEEFPELVAQAKERARQKAEEAIRAAKALEEQKRTGAKSQGSDDIFDIESTAVNADPTVELLITSEIEGTNPLRVRRKISQKMLEVKTAWCDKQVIDGEKMGAEFREKVFLTWKSMKLFDSSSCKGLGLGVDEYGNLVSKGGVVDPEGRVHLEAWTEEHFAAYRKREEAKAQGEEPEILREPPVKKTKLVLKSKDLPEHKIVVKPTTTIARLTEAFKDANDLPEEAVVTLYLDGDQLDPDSTIGDTELDDMDTVEVHIR